MPHFSGDNRPRIDSFNWCADHREELTEKRSSAARMMFDKHEAEQREKAAMARPVKGKEAW
jgi:limonene 1,2-monooxygenase